MKKALSNKKSLRLCIFIFLISSSIYQVAAQGGWSIGYIPCDSITDPLIGRKIKIDFRNDSADKRELDKRFANHGLETSPVFYLRAQDTVHLFTQNEHFIAYEVRDIGPDYGYYKDQYFLMKETSGNNPLKVWESEIIEINESAIHFKFFIGKDEFPSFRNIWIDRKLIDGVMYYKNL